MAGYFGGHDVGLETTKSFASERKRAWLPVRSTLSGERVWLKHYWKVERIELISPGYAPGLGWSVKKHKLTEDEYLLFRLGFSAS